MAPVTPDAADPGPAESAPSVSVVVTGWRDSPHLVGCLRSLSAHPPLRRFDLVVFLNEPVDGVTEAITSEAPGATVMSSPVNLGFAGACNRAAATARGEYLMFVNDDAVVEPGWLDALLDTADADPDAGAVGGRILAPDGSVREAGTVIWSDGSVTLIDEYHWPHPPPPAGARQVDYCSAASLLVRASVWREVGGLDEGYFPAYYEDVDLCLKIQSTGRRVLYEPASVIRHRHGASAELSYRLFLIERNRGRLVERWHHVLADRLDAAPDDPAALARAVTMAAERTAAPFEGPRLPDVRTAGVELDEAWARHRQGDVLEAYARSLEVRLAAEEDRRRRRPLTRIVAAAKRYGRHLPGARRLVIRLRRARPGWGRRRSG